MRLFLAIPLPDHIRRLLASVVDRARSAEAPHWGDAIARWVRPENLHVTLKFLGEVAEDGIDVMIASFSQVATPGVFALHVGGLELFPRKGPVRVITAGLDGDLDRLALLHCGIESACHELGIQADGRPFRPHVTMGRVRPGVNVNRITIETLSGLSHMQPAAFTATEFVLMRSHLSPTGSVYDQVTGFPLEKK